MLIESVQNDPDHVRFQRDVITEYHDLMSPYVRPFRGGLSAPAESPCSCSRLWALSTPRIVVRLLPTLVSESIPMRIDIEAGQKRGIPAGPNSIRYGRQKGCKTAPPSETTDTRKTVSILDSEGSEAQRGGCRDSHTDRSCRAYDQKTETNPNRGHSSRLSRV